MRTIWTAVLAVYTTLWCIPVVTSQEQPAFFLAVTFRSRTAFFNFTDVMFQKFYHCLRNRIYDQCEIQRDDYNNVISVRGCLPVGNIDTTDELTCKPLTPNQLLCKRGSYSDESQIVRCPDANFHNYENENDADLSTTARTTWLGFDIILMESHISGITAVGLNSPSPQSYKFVISGTFTTTLLPPTPTPPPPTTTATTETMTTKTKTTVSAATKTSKSIPSASPIAPATTVGSLGTSEHESDVGGDNTGIIIGAAVGGAVVVVVIVIIVVILWRRKNRASSSSSANNNKIDDADIYPYENSNLNNVNSNLNPNNQNTAPNEPTQNTFATVDPSEKRNNANTSTYYYNTVNIDNDNKLEQTKTQFNPSLDYIEIDETTEAGHYQRISDVNNHEISTSGIMPPPHPSDSSAQPKYTYYNVSF